MSPRSVTTDNGVVKVLMQRDGMEADEACAWVEAAIDDVAEGKDPEEILHSVFGLEPDYIFDILP